jgi:hypothetical protein
VREGPAEAVDLPHHQHIAGVQEFQAGFQPRPIVARTRGLVLVEVPLVDTGGDQRVALQSLPSRRRGSADWRSSVEEVRM